MSAPNPESQRLRAAIDSAPSGLLMTNAEGQIVMVNREIERMFDYAREELLGRSVELLVPDLVRPAHETWRDAFMRSARERRMAVGRDLHGRRKDGSAVPLEIGLTPVATRDGMFVVSSVIDASERRRAEGRLRVAVESAPCGMLMVDASGSILLANRELERMFGYAPGELAGASVERLVPASVRARHPGWRSAFLDRPQARAMGSGRELHGVRKDGSEIAVEIGLNPIETDEGALVLGSVVDVTARRVAEEERAELEARLRQSQKLESLGRLAGGIAHDFNNILSAISGYAEMLRLRAPDVEPTGDVAGILAAVQRGKDVTSRIARFHRKESLELRPLDLVGAVREAVRLVRAALPETVHVELDLDRPDPVLADPTSIHAVVMNLATNASHAMERGGTLRIALESYYARDSVVRAHPGLREGHYVKLIVSDDGVGMDEEARARAFEPFFTTKPPGQGTGLGLATVHALMRDQGGAVWIDSALGKGTSVHCLFPTAERAPLREPAGDVQLARGAGERILFVDDEPTLAELGARQLNRAGYRAIAAVSARAAMALLESDADFDALVSDLTMPEMNGIELARAAARARPGMPVLILSGRSDLVPRATQLEAGIRRVLGKPITLVELAREIRAVLDERRSP